MHILDKLLNKYPNKPMERFSWSLLGSTVQTILKNPESIIRPCILVTSFWCCSFHVTYTCTASEFQPKWFNKMLWAEVTASVTDQRPYVFKYMNIMWTADIQMISYLSQVRWIQQIGLLPTYGSSYLSWRSIAALTQRPWVRIPLNPQKHFLGLIAIA